MHLSALVDYMATVKCLVHDAGADVNLPLCGGEYGNALITAAASYAATETVKCLSRSGVDANTLPTVGGYGSVLAAAIDDETTKCLLEAGGNMNAHLYRLRQHGATS